MSTTDKPDPDPVVVIEPDAPPVPPPDVKPGWQTSEFWLSLLAMLLTALYASGVVPTKGTTAAVVAIVASLLTASGYAVARTIAKK